MTQTNDKGQEVITAKQLAEKAKVESTTLRRVLRQHFPRANKGKPYEWKPDDPEISRIIKKVKEVQNKATKAKAEKADKPAEKKADKPTAEKQGKTEEK